MTTTDLLKELNIDPSDVIMIRHSRKNKGSRYTEIHNDCDTLYEHYEKFCEPSDKVEFMRYFTSMQGNEKLLGKANCRKYIMTFIGNKDKEAEFVAIFKFQGHSDYTKANGDKIFKLHLDVVNFGITENYLGKKVEWNDCISWYKDYQEKIL